MKKILSILLGSMLVLTITACGNETASEKQKEYYCEAGTLNGENCEVVETEEATPTCEENYKLTNNQCVKTTTANAKATKTCSDGYTLSGSTCLSKTTYNKVTTKDCVLPQKLKDEGFSKGNLESDGKCHTSMCAKYNGDMCMDGIIEEYNPTTVTSCPSGTKEISGKCYKTSKVKTNYTCEKGKLSGSKCTVTDTKEVTNTCQTDGFTYNTESKQCEKVTTTKALEK